MENPFPNSKILQLVKDTLSRVLGIPASEIRDDNSMVNELGAESLDFVELNSLIEKTLNLTLPTKSVLDHAGKISGHPERFYSNKQGLTDEGVSLLEHSPYRYQKIVAGTNAYDIFNASAVQNLANMCHAILNHLPSACPDCGHHAAMISSAGKPICAACSATLHPLHGDEVLALSVSRYLARQETSNT